VTLAAGARLGSYEVTGPLGAGGMGEVYRARDTRLGRDVAIKALPAAFEQEPERLARFEREAKLLASLSHPNVGAIYGLEEANGHRYLVLEFVEGETLARRLTRGPLPLEEALEVCRQIAAAVEAAHESGIVHRDLKPGNVMITPSGGVKVLDFGLAKSGAASGSSSDPSLSASPTMTYSATGAGVILGTAAYMSPEQARGKAVDKRTDIWSFGCVLYECLTGRQVFEGETVSDLIARILERDPDLGALPAPTPNRVRELLRRCLEKDGRRRLRDIGDAKIEIEDVLAVRSSGSARAAAAAGRPGSVLGLAAFGAAVALVSVAATLLVPAAFRRAPPARPTRFPVLAPEAATLAADGAECSISPDGRTLAFVAVDSGGTALVWARPLESLTARPLPGTENGDLPFWSPDSRFVGFFADGKLKKVPVQGGAPEVLCDANNGRGGTWNASGVIVFCPAGEGPLYQVSASGGDPRPVTSLDSTRHETGHRFPCFLPDGRHFLFSVLPGRQGKLDIDVGSLDSPKRAHVLAATSGAVYAPPGDLIFERNLALAAQRFDARRLRLVGDPLSLGDVPAASNYTGARLASASATGTLAFLSGQILNTTPVWVDRSGRTQGTVHVPAGRYTGASLSPDGRRALLVRENGPTESDLWMVELDRGVMTRFTYGPSQNTAAVWSPDASRIAFESDRDGPFDFFVKPASGATAEEPLLQSSAFFKHLGDWSRDGKIIVYQQLDARTGWDLWILPLEGDRTPRPYLRTPFNERFGSLSPDGKWMAYSSDESGRSEVYVQSFPAPGNKVQISTGGGFAGAWRSDGREILFAGPDGQTTMSADVTTAPEFRASAPRAINKLPSNLAGLAITPDFQRLLLLLPSGDAVPASVTIVLDWNAALRRP
jgi:Tol biopolymer transport system component